MSADVEDGRNVRPMPADLVEMMRRVLGEVDVDWDEPIDGEVKLD